MRVQVPLSPAGESSTGHITRSAGSPHTYPENDVAQWRLDVVRALLAAWSGVNLSTEPGGRTVEQLDTQPERTGRMAGQKNGVKFPASLPIGVAPVSIEELRAKVNLLGHYASQHGVNQWWYLDAGGPFPKIIGIRKGRYGRDTEREVLEEVLSHYGVLHGH